MGRVLYSGDWMLFVEYDLATVDLFMKLPQGSFK